MAALVSPIVDIILRLWTCCARHTRYLRKLQKNKNLLSITMNELKEARDDVQRRVVEEEADPNEPKRRTEQVRGWLERVHTIEDEVEKILQKADAQLSRASYLGGCCPPNNCWSNYKFGKSIAKKIPLVDDLKGKGNFQEVTYILRPPFVDEPTSYLSILQENKILLSTAMDELKEARDDVQRKVVEAEADPSEPKMRTDQVRGWLQRVEIIESEVQVILQKADAQLSRARCLGGCCPPNNCCSNYKVGKSIAKKIPLVKDLKVKGYFQELTFVARPTNYLSKLQDNKILLRSAMEELKNVRNDVQRKVVEAEADQSEPRMRTDQVHGWLQSVEIIEGEVELIMQTSDEQLSNAECHEKNKLVVIKMASVGELKRNVHFEEVTYRLPPPSVQDINLVSTVGMESMFDKVWSLINNTNDKQPVNNIIGLYGQGGVGKTTLLEKINNEFNKIGGFDIVMFVVVSKQLNYEAIQMKIGERLGLSLQGDESSKANKIFNALGNKNYVLLLDDIWERVDLRRIGIPMRPKGNSKIIFTTRSEIVCGEMKADNMFKVECLPMDKAWRLFEDNLGWDALDYSREVSGYANMVARKCDGLPLALITIGRSMSTNKSVNEWKHAIGTLQRYASKFTDMRDNVLPRLKLSYDNLRNETEKSCFRYCALFPENYFIEITKLVELWIAEGFLDRYDNLDEARDDGHHIIKRLKSMCLLESSGEDHVKMHDVIRDLALWIVNDCNSDESVDESDSNSDKKFLSDNKFLVAVNDPCKKWENAERIFWDATHYTTTSSEEENPPACPNLLTLIVKISNTNGYCLCQSFFQDMPLLRVLDLSNTCLYEPIPISICTLPKLQYLNLSETYISELPVELRKLVKLKFLVLNTSKLRRIPAGLIANISELQVLDLGHDLSSLSFDDWELENGPSFSELDYLKQLQEVRITISTYVALEKFLCNRKLQMVCTGLKFSSPDSSSSSSSSSSRRVLDLSTFKSLKDLVLYGRTTDGVLPELEKLVLYGRTTDRVDRALLSSLETLTLGGFSKLNNILWMAEQPDLLPSYFLNLHYIQIVGCHALKDLTWLVYVHRLKTLSVEDCEGLETIVELGDDGLLEGGAEGGHQILLNRRVFGELNTLVLYRLPKLKSICSHALAFFSIYAITIIDCPELKKLPLGSISNVNTLKVIEGKEEWWNKLQWEDETIKSKFLPYFRERSWFRYW